MIEDMELAAAISAAILLYMESCAVVVGVSHGLVTLEGDVDSPDRRQDVEHVARRFAGVRDIVNDITVRAVAAEATASSADLPASE